MKSTIRRMIPPATIRLTQYIQTTIGLVALSWAHKKRLSSDLYYLVTGSFSNEHQAVLKGRRAYYNSLKNIGATCVLLRRNIHRLEKGLIMRPRKDIFAESFILETAIFFKDAALSTTLADAEKKWANDVLHEYFNAVGSSATIDKARKIYYSARIHQSIDLNTNTTFPSQDGSYKPYSYNMLPAPTISYDELRRLFIRRRSVRWYQNKPVPFDLIQTAVDIASYAPTACNRQPYRFLFCGNKKKVVAIANCAMGTTGFSDNLPAIITVVGDLSAYPFDRDRHLIYIDASLAAMQLMLALETLGLSTCPINWPEISKRERKIRKIIEIEDYERIIMLLAVGYASPTGEIPYSQKKTGHLVLENISE